MSQRAPVHVYLGSRGKHFIRAGDLCDATYHHCAGQGAPAVLVCESDGCLQERLRVSVRPWKGHLLQNAAPILCLGLSLHSQQTTFGPVGDLAAYKALICRPVLGLHEVKKARNGCTKW